METRFVKEKVSILTMSNFFHRHYYFRFKGCFRIEKVESYMALTFSLTFWS